MTQTRLHLTTSKAEAERIFIAMEQAFEDDGWPISVMEIDEDRDLHEISLYADGDVEAVEAQLRDLLIALSVEKPLEREVLPDIDWVARSLEGLKPVRAGRFFVHGAHDRDQIKEGDTPVDITAGLD